MDLSPDAYRKDSARNLKLLLPTYGIYLFHYLAIWIGFVVCRDLNVALQIVIFGAVLVSLSVLLYHTVEAPLIAAGVTVSQKFMRPSLTREVNVHSGEPAAQIFPDLSRSS